MTAKRFSLAYADYDWWAICDKENPTEQGISCEDVVELLNELHEENIILKKELDDASKLLDGLTIPELLELIKQYEDLNIHFSKIKTMYIDEKRRLIGIDYDD